MIPQSEERAVEVSGEDTIDLDAANSDSPNESIKDAPIDLDNISEDDSSMEISSNVDMRVKKRSKKTRKLKRYSNRSRQKS